MHSHADGIVKVTVKEGPLKGTTYEVTSHEKTAFDLGLKTSYGKGAGVIVYIAEGTSEPKLSFDCSSAREVADKIVSAVRISNGHGKARTATCTISHVFRRGGKTLAYRFTGCKLSGGGGYDSDDSGVKGKMEFMMKRAELSIDGSEYQVIT